MVNVLPWHFCTTSRVEIYFSVLQCFCKGRNNWVAVRDTFGQLVEKFWEASLVWNFGFLIHEQYNALKNAFSSNKGDTIAWLAGHCCTNWTYEIGKNGCLEIWNLFKINFPWNNSMIDNSCVNSIPFKVRISYRYLRVKKPPFSMKVKQYIFTV